MSRARRVDLTLGEVRAVFAGRFVRVELGAPVRLPDGLRAMSALVGRVGDRVVAWANRCQHNPVPLDAGDVPMSTDGAVPAPLADDGRHLMCHSHGALYRPIDGMCVLGPCYGQRLFPIEVDAHGGAIALLVDG